MNAITKITIRASLLRLEQIALLLLGLLLILPFLVVYLSENLSHQILDILTSMSADQQEVSREMLLAAMLMMSELFTTLVALLLIPMLIYRDEQHRMLSFYLTRPLSRERYFLAKYLGGTLSLFVFFSVFACFILAVSFVHSPNITGYLIQAYFFALLKLALLSALLIGLTTRFSIMFGSIAALLIYIAGHSNIQFLIWSILNPGILSTFFKTGYYVLPDLLTVSSWSILSAVIEKKPIEIPYVYWIIKHLLIYIPLFLLIGTASFRKRQL
ncbi:hypothetical protein ACFL4Q_04190 [candidate division KSB1 bacterium]